VALGLRDHSLRPCFLLPGIPPGGRFVHERCRLLGEEKKNSLWSPVVCQGCGASVISCRLEFLW
jgi:hypothetical protein